MRRFLVLEARLHCPYCGVAHVDEAPGHATHRCAVCHSEFAVFVWGSAESPPDPGADDERV